MKLNVLTPIGAEAAELTLTELNPTTVGVLRDLLAEHGVIVFRDQTLDDGAFTGFLHAFGPLAFTEGEAPLERHPQLNEVSNVGRTAPPRSQFHVDTSYVRRPPAYTALRAVTIPRQGGETVFSDQYRAYDTLPDDLRELLDGRSITHVVTGLELGDEAETSAEHPVFRRHPVSGRIALYLSTPSRCAAITGLDEEQTREIVARLLEHSTRPDNLYRHAWRPGDVVMWDNGCVMHRADHGGVVGDRVMHRGMVAGYPSDDELAARLDD